jgi:hypothetical protein
MVVGFITTYAISAYHHLRTDGCQVMAIAHLTLRVRWAKKTQKAQTWHIQTEALNRGWVMVANTIFNNISLPGAIKASDWLKFLMIFFSDTTWRMELKIVMNDHCKLLTKCCYFLGRLESNNTWLDHANEHSCHAWSHLIQWFSRRRLKCLRTDDRRQVMAIAHLTLWFRWNWKLSWMIIASC